MKYSKLNPRNFRITIEYKNPDGWQLIDKLAAADAEQVLNMKGLCRRFSISYSTLRYRIKIGLSMWESLTKAKTEPTFFH